MARICEIQVGDATLLQIRDRFKGTPLPPAQVKEKQEPPRIESVTASPRDEREEDPPTVASSPGCAHGEPGSHEDHGVICPDSNRFAARGVGMPATIHLPAAEPGLEEALERALRWHSSAPVRVEEPRSAAYGAILRGLDKRDGSTLGVYTEITGYALSLCTFLLRGRGDARYLHVAREAADYLLRIQTAHGAFPDLPHPEDPAGRVRLYSFDTATCVVGMARLARAVQDGRFSESAVAAGRWLLGMQRPDGSFFAMELPDRGLQDPGGFFGDGSCIHAKNAIALLELHAITGREELRAAAVKACEHSLALQSDDGAIWSGPGRHYVFTHAHCYACEGLLYAGTILGEGRFLTAAWRGIEWLARSQRPDGGWLSHYKASARSPRRMAELLWKPEPTDAAAQAARLFRLMGRDYEVQRRAAIGFLTRCQDIGGGFFYRKSIFGFSPLLYSWCAQFAVQALAWNSGQAAVEDLF